MDNWTAEMRSLYDRARNSGNLTYGIWRVREAEGVYTVTDLKGTPVVTGITAKPLAELIASIPDLCDPDLRPASAPGSIVSHDRRTMPLMGVVDVQAVHDTAFRKGFKAGEKKGWEESQR